MCEVCDYKLTDAENLEEGYERAIEGVAQGTLVPTHKDDARCIYGCPTSPNWLIFARTSDHSFNHYVSSATTPRV